MIVANGARVHEQDRYEYGDDEAPPGICFHDRPSGPGARRAKNPGPHLC